MLAVGENLILNAVGEISGTPCRRLGFQTATPQLIFAGWMNLSPPCANRTDGISGRVATDKNQSDRKRAPTITIKSRREIFLLPCAARSTSSVRFNPLRSQFKCPRDDERDWKSDHDCETINRTAQFGISKNGKTCVATWTSSQPTTA